MSAYHQGRDDARLLFKVANILADPLGRRIVSQTLSTILHPEHKPRIVRTLEPYIDTYIGGDPNAFARFDDRFRDDD